MHSPTHSNPLPDPEEPEEHEQEQEEDDEEEEEDFDFIPFLREDLPSDNSSGLTDTESPIPPQNPKPIPPQNPNPNTEEELVGPTGDVNGEDEEAICRRTRAKVSLENYSLDELEAFLQGSDDEADAQNVDEEEEYRRFLAAVLSDELPYNTEEAGPADEDENDADFEAELEEALESDPEEEPSQINIPLLNPKKRTRPETRQIKLQSSPKNNNNNSKNNNINYSPAKSLRPILPIEPFPATPLSINLNLCNDLITERQLAELNKQVHEHVQLLVQVFSISVLDPTRQSVASDTGGLINEMILKREEAVKVKRGNCVDNDNYGDGLSVLDIETLRLAKGFLEDVSSSVYKYRQSQLNEPGDKTYAQKEPLFPLPSKTFTTQNQTAVTDGGPHASDHNDNYNSNVKRKKSLAASIVESAKKGSVALVPADVARLAYRFVPFFDWELVPHKPPPASVTNRILFTDAEDRLLALGVFYYNNDRAAIRNHYLPCKDEHQIFVRVKNQKASKAPENPIKAVKRLKEAPLTEDEKARIKEGLKMFKNDWDLIWKYMVPYRDKNLLYRQWQDALGIKTKKKKKKSEKEKDKHRISEAKRRQLKRLNQCPQEDNEMDVDGINGDKETENNNSSNNNINNNNKNNNNNNNEEEAYVHEAFLADPDQNQNNSDAFNNNNNNNNINNNNKYPNKYPYNNHLETRPRFQRVIKLAPDLPPINLPKSVRVISASSLKLPEPSRNTPPPTTAPLPPRQLNLFPGFKNRETNSRIDSDFQMHPLLFSSAQEITNGEFCREVPESNENVEFHPLLQRDESNGECIDLNIQLFSPIEGLIENDSQLEVVNANINHFVETGSCSLNPRITDKEIGREIINEDSIQGIVMEQEELSDSDEESENVEFEREEMEDSDDDALESVQHFVNPNKDLGNKLREDVGNKVKARGSKQKENIKKRNSLGNKKDLKSQKSRAINTKLGQLDPGTSKKPRKPRKKSGSN